MSGTGPGQIRTLAFGDLEAGVWGCAWSDTKAAAAFGTIGAAGAATADDATAGAATAGPATVSGSSASEGWTVSSALLELNVSSLTPAAEIVPLDGFDQLCRVTGRASVNEIQHEIECFGHRGVRAAPDFARLDSLRDLSGWFGPGPGPGDGFALTALRPRPARGHDHDSVFATVFEHGGAMAVADPRLSSTYRGDGRLLKAGLELWLDDEQEPYPRRAAADAVADGVRLSEAAFEVTVWPLRWHSRGEQGAGLYLLAVPR